MKPRQNVFLPALVLLGTTAASCSSVVIPTEGGTDGLVATDGSDTIEFDATDSGVRDVGPEGLEWMEWFPDGYVAPFNIRSCRTNRYPLQIDLLWTFFSDSITADLVQFSTPETPFSAPRSVLLGINTNQNPFGRVVENCAVRNRGRPAVGYQRAISVEISGMQSIRLDLSASPWVGQIELNRSLIAGETVRASYYFSPSLREPLPTVPNQAFEVPFPPSTQFRVPMGANRIARAEGAGVSFEWGAVCSDYVAVHFHGENLADDLGHCVFAASEGRGVIPMGVFDALREYVSDGLERVTLTFSVVNAAPEFDGLIRWPTRELLLRSTSEFAYVPLR